MLLPPSAEKLFTIREWRQWSGSNGSDLQLQSCAISPNSQLNDIERNAAAAAAADYCYLMGCTAKHKHISIKDNMLKHKFRNEMHFQCQIQSRSLCNCATKGASCHEMYK